MEEGGEEVDLLTSLGLRGSPDRLSVDREGLDLVCQSGLGQDPLKPARDRLLDLQDVDRLEGAPEGGLGGSDPDLCLGMLPESQALFEGVREIGGPFGHGERVAGAGEKGAHEGGDEGDMGVADPPPLPGIRHPGQIVHERLDVFFAESLDGHAGLLCLENGKVVGRRQKTKRIPPQRSDEDALDLPVVVVSSGVSSVPFGFPKILEACGLIAGSGKAGGIDEGFDEQDGMAVLDFPVGREAMQAESQDLRGQVGTTNPRKNEIAHVVGQIAQAPGPLGSGPSDHPVSVSIAPGGGSPAQEGDPLPVQKGDIADRLPGHSPESEVVVSPHLFVPPDSLGSFDGMHNQLIETVPVQGVGVGIRIHGARIGRSQDFPDFCPPKSPLAFFCLSVKNQKNREVIETLIKIWEGKSSGKDSKRSAARTLRFSPIRKDTGE